MESAVLETIASQTRVCVCIVWDLDKVHILIQQLCVQDATLEKLPGDSHGADQDHSCRSQAPENYFKKKYSLTCFVIISGN